MKNSLFFSLILTVSLGHAYALSFQGQDDIKSNFIHVDEKERNGDGTFSTSEDAKQALSDQREEMRKMRLFILGALTEQLVAWFFQDIIPKDIIHRTKRSLHMSGKFFKFEHFEHHLILKSNLNLRMSSIIQFVDLEYVFPLSRKNAFRTDINLSSL